MKSLRIAILAGLVLTAQALCGCSQSQDFSDDSKSSKAPSPPPGRASTQVGTKGADVISGPSSTQNVGK